MAADFGNTALDHAHHPYRNPADLSVVEHDLSPLLRTLVDADARALVHLEDGETVVIRRSGAHQDRLDENDTSLRLTNLEFA